jgi:hypothetical protein
MEGMAQIFSILTMATSTKNKTTRKKMAVVDKTKKDYANDPFFIKKRETALKVIKKAGLPDTFTKK